MPYCKEIYLPLIDQTIVTMDNKVCSQKFAFSARRAREVMDYRCSLSIIMHSLAFGFDEQQTQGESLS